MFSLRDTDLVSFLGGITCFKLNKTHSFVFLFDYVWITFTLIINIITNLSSIPTWINYRWIVVHFSMEISFLTFYYTLYSLIFTTVYLRNTKIFGLAENDSRWKAKREFKEIYGVFFGYEITRFAELPRAILTELCRWFPNIVANITEYNREKRWNE